MPRMGSGSPPPALTTTWDRVLGWRLRRQFVADRDATDTPTVVRRLAGVQAQVMSSAGQAVAVRRVDQADGVEDALADRSILRTWAMRGTLHLLTADDAPAVLSLLGSARSWEKGAWQREFASADTMATLAETADRVLDDAVLTRDELVAAFAGALGGAHEHLGSGWGVLLKPLAWQGLLCNGTPDGSRPTFTSPRTWVSGWPGLPDPDAAAGVVVPRYLAAHGPASIDTFGAWLLRGAHPRRQLRAWFTDLVEAGTLARVDVRDAATGPDRAGSDRAGSDRAGSDSGPSQGARTELYARTADLDDLADTAPAPGLRLLPGFDQYVLGPGTGDPQVVPPEHRQQVSRAAGWIAPVIVAHGRVVGTWTIPPTPTDPPGLEPFGPSPDPTDVAAERAVWTRILSGSNTD